MNQKLKLFTALCMTFSVYASAQSSQNEQAAKVWIREHSKELKLKSTDDFKLSFVRKSLSGETLRFQQMVSDVPVFKSEIVVHFNPHNEITNTSDSYVDKDANISAIPSTTQDAAITKSNEELRAKIDDGFSYQECKLFITTQFQEPKLIYRIITNPNSGIGSWEVMIDAQKGTVLSTRDVALYDHKEKPKKKSKEEKEKSKNTNMTPLGLVTTGTALVYDPDPLSVAQHSYSGSYINGTGANEDATNASLDAARSAVTLPEIDLTDGVYKLKSSYVEIKNFEAPNKGLFTQSTSDFSFNRSQDGFEAVNAFYHLDKSVRYINETLGIICRPSLNAGIFYYDPSGLSGDDNSHYIPSTQRIAFGEGGVDDAEDADVILHEFGHGIHDWITNGSTPGSFDGDSDDGLGEGSGDYWAQSYSRSLNQWPVATSTSSGYQKVFNWDGPAWGSTRNTNYAANYPSGVQFQDNHEDGQIWSTALMRIYDVIGRTKTDKIFIEGLALTDHTSTQQDAAIGARQAAIDMNYSCADVQIITTKFASKVYVMPALSLTVNCPTDQTVDPDTSGNYNVVDFTGLSNAISNNCDAVITQSPAMGTMLTEGTYPVTMTAVSGASTKICSFNLIVNSVLGISNPAKDFASIYPNPSSSIITIKGSFASSEKVAIYNMLGQRVIEKTISNDKNIIDISKLTNGVYAIYFESNKFTSKFVKN